VRPAAIALLTVAACGDNLPGPPPGPELAPARTMFVIAHFDDDMIFMQPELVDAGSAITVYMTSGDPVKGNGRADEVFAAARAARGGSWDCGYIWIGGLPAHHCRSGEMSLVGLDLPDGGLDGERTDSLLHLVEGKITRLPVLGPIGGHASEDEIIGELAEMFELTQPAEVHALDVAATHGRDHSSHLMSSSFALWAAARVGYAGPIRWHRGYNVDGEAVTLTGGDYDAAAAMLGAFDARYFGMPGLDPQEDAWMQRQYAFDRVAAAAVDPFVLDESGHLRSGSQCLASAAGGAVAPAPCAAAPEQYWLLDGEGHLWNGLPPDPAADMDYDHVRCLAAVDSAPTCGADHDVTWSFR